jgi:broad specificity phosphatase PhoE
MKSWLISPSRTKFPKGEKFQETVDRVGEFIFHTNWQGDNLVVTHDNIIRIMICFAKDLPIDAMWQTELDPAAVNIFVVEGVNGTKKIKLKKLNITKHLKDLRADLSNHAL